jgi:predicted nuclease of predicted toxin-antitoxin system
VKLLFDQNLSHRLPYRLDDLFPGSEHVRSAGLDQAPDDWIWEHARKNGFAIVTQDSDFAERSRLYGPPPKVVWLRCGNSTPHHIETLLRSNAASIALLERDARLHCLEIC